MNTTEADILKMLTEVEKRFRALQKVDGITPSWLFSPHEAAFEKIKKEINDTIDFIKKFTPKDEQPKKLQMVLKTLCNCDYAEKIEVEREENEE